MCLSPPYYLFRNKIRHIQNTINTDQAYALAITKVERAKNADLDNVKDAM